MLEISTSKTPIPKRPGDPIIDSLGRTRWGTTKRLLYAVLRNIDYSIISQIVAWGEVAKELCIQGTVVTEAPRLAEKRFRHWYNRNRGPVEHFDEENTLFCDSAELDTAPEPADNADSNNQKSMLKDLIFLESMVECSGGGEVDWDEFCRDWDISTPSEARKHHYRVRARIRNWAGPRNYQVPFEGNQNSQPNSQYKTSKKRKGEYVSTENSDGDDDEDFGNPKLDKSELDRELSTFYNGDESMDPKYDTNSLERQDQEDIKHDKVKLDEELAKSTVMHEQMEHDFDMKMRTPSEHWFAISSIPQHTYKSPYKDHAVNKQTQPVTASRQENANSRMEINTTKDSLDKVTQSLNLLSNQGGQDNAEPSKGEEQLMKNSDEEMGSDSEMTIARQRFEVSILQDLPE